MRVMTIIKGFVPVACYKYGTSICLLASYFILISVVHELEVSVTFVGGQGIIY